MRITIGQLILPQLLLKEAWEKLRTEKLVTVIPMKSSEPTVCMQRKQSEGDALLPDDDG